MRDIYFHEDDFCQQQLLPIAAAAHAQSELTNIKEFAQAHLAPGGYGWTEVYVRKEPPVGLASLHIRREDIAAVVSPSLPSFDAIYTGYSTYREPCKNTAAWGFSSHCALFADWVDDGTVANIWCELFDSTDASMQAASKAIAALGKRYSLVYVDWAWDYLCDASDEQRFSLMLKAKLDVLGERLRSMNRQ